MLSNNKEISSKYKVAIIKSSSVRINNLLSVFFDIFTHFTGADICEFFYIEGIKRASPESLRNGQIARTSQNSLMVGCG